MKVCYFIFLILTVFKAYSSSEIVFKFKTFGSSVKADDYYGQRFPEKKNLLIDRVKHKQQYDYIEEIIEEVHEAYINFFPSKKINPASPHVILRDESAPTAFVWPDYKEDFFPYLIDVSAALLKLPKDKLRAILTHEMGHLLLHGLHKGELFPKSRYYLSASKVKFSNSIFHNSELELFTKQKENLLWYAGPFINKALGNIPFHYNTKVPSQFKVLVYLLNNLSETKRLSNSCDMAISFVISHRKLVLEKHFSNKMLSLTFKSNKDRDNLLNFSKMTEKYLRKCFVGVKISYLDLMKEVYGESFKSVIDNSKLLSDKGELLLSKVQAYHEQLDVIDALFSYSSEFKAEVRKIDETYDPSKVRVFNLEDDADETAIRVLKSVNKSYISFSENILKENNYKGCDYKNLQDPPAYGPIFRVHHDACWRAYRNYQLEIKLKD